MVHFIEMKNNGDGVKLDAHFVFGEMDCDREKSYILRIYELGLMELSRQTIVHCGQTS
jgi:Ribonuclease G/E